MTIKSIIAIVLVLVAGAAMPLHAQSQDPFWFADKEYKRLGLDYWISTPLQGQVVKGAPYSAEVTIESIQTLSDGNRIVHRSSEKVYRDSEGRVRREETKGSEVTITITDPVAGKTFTLIPATRTVRQTAMLPLWNFHFGNQGMLWDQYLWAYRGATAPGGRGSMTGTFSADAKGTKSPTFVVGGGGNSDRVRRPAGADYAEEHLPNRTIEGVLASGVRRTTTIPQGAIGNEQPIKIVSEEWTSSDLQVLVLTETNDPRTGRSTYKLSNINRANPDPALFKAPLDYTMAGRGRGK
jgi:hypothetical protein